MGLELRNHVLLRDAERARIARWFGDTDLGPIFFVDSGAALPLDADERDLWQRRAERELDVWIGQYRRIPIEVIGIALTLMLLVAAANALVSDLVPSFAAIATPLLYAPALAWPMLRERMYRNRLKGLRRDLAERLQFRTKIPSAITLPHRRHNIFTAISLSIAIAALAIVAVGLMRHDERFGLLLIVALTPFAWLFHWARRRVDRVHRRRPESLGRAR